MLVVDAVVDDRDLHALASRTRRARERGTRRSPRARGSGRACRSGSGRPVRRCPCRGGPGDARRGRSPRSRSRAPGSGARRRASGIASRSSAIAFACAACKLLTYERENELEKFSFGLRAESGEPARVRGRGERRIVERHDDADAVVGVPGEARDVGGAMNLLERALDHAPRCPVDGAGRRPGDGDGDEEGRRGALGVARAAR